MANANMRDVAQLAGVSVATVSHVINNTRFVSDNTRCKVLDCIKQLEYNPDAMARIFKTGRKNLIGFIVPDIANSFFSTIIEEVENTISNKNYKLIVANTHETPQREVDNIRLLANGIVDGLLVATTLRDFDEIRKLVPDDLPMVFLDRNIKSCPCDIVIVNNYMATCSATEDLIRAGHTRIGCSSNSVTISTTEERVNAYRDTLAKYNLDPYIISLPNPTVTLFSPILDEALKNGLTALLTLNNVATIGALAYIDKHNISIGKDLDLVAYQDSLEPYYFLHHAAVITQPVKEIGRFAGERILERLAQPTIPVRQTILQAVYTPKH